MQSLWVKVLFYVTCILAPFWGWGKGFPFYGDVDSDPALIASTSHSEISGKPELPPYWRIWTKIPQSSQKALYQSFHRKSLPYWAWILGSSSMLYVYDPPILREAQRLGRKSGLGNKDNTEAYFKVGDVPLFRGPTDIGSFMYFLGDGWFHVFIGVSFLWRGRLVNSPRAMNTGWALFHGMVTSTLFNQILKRSTGRESPNQSTTYRGAWRPFPNFKDYHTETAKYDAVPSGHIMTATLTLTVIQQNYPEYTSFVTPLGWTLITLLSFQMMNNGVHWASDYPLGIAMGILFGRISASQFSTPQDQAKKEGLFGEKKFVLLPYANKQGVGLNLGWAW